MKKYQSGWGQVPKRRGNADAVPGVCDMGLLWAGSYSRRMGVWSHPSTVKQHLCGLRPIAILFMWELLMRKTDFPACSWDVGSSGTHTFHPSAFNTSSLSLWVDLIFFLCHQLLHTQEQSAVSFKVWHWFSLQFHASVPTGEYGERKVSC